MIKKCLYAIFLLLLIIPFIQSKVRFVEEEKLGGSYVNKNVKLPAFTLPNLQNNSFQSSLAEKVKEELGFKQTLIRINNQLNYSLYRELGISGVVVGKDDMLIPQSYIDSYYGLDYIGDEKITTFTDKLAYAQEQLSSRDIAFLLFIVPGKASLNLEKIPNFDEELARINTSNYEAILPKLDAKGINYFDAVKFAKNLKRESNYQLFPSNSVHWSANTVANVGSELIAEIENKFDLLMPRMKISRGKTTVKDFRYTDYDIGESLNLLWNIAEDTLYYPTVSFEHPNSNMKPTMLGVGDSYFQSFTGFYPILDSMFSEDSRLYYYNKFIDWPYKFRGKEVLHEYVDIELELRSTDIVILQMTEENIRKSGYGFLDDLKRFFQGQNNVRAKDSLRFVDFMNDVEVKEKAKNLHHLLGYSELEMRQSIAKKMLLKDFLTPEERAIKLKEKILEIKANPEWFDKVKSQAFERGISIEENLKKNAEWILDNN